MQYLQPLITASFWFNMTPPPFVRPIFIGLGIALIVIFVAGAVIKWLGYRARRNPPIHRILSRVGRAVLSIAAAGLFLYFFSYEQIRVMSARLWWGLLALGALVWAIFIIIDVIKNYPIEKKLLAERLAREKYLPK